MKGFPVHETAQFALPVVSLVLVAGTKRAVEPPQPAAAVDENGLPERFAVHAELSGEARREVFPEPPERARPFVKGAERRRHLRDGVVQVGVQMSELEGKRQALRQFPVNEQNVARANIRDQQVGELQVAVKVMTPRFLLRERPNRCPAGGVQIGEAGEVRR